MTTTWDSDSRMPKFQNLKKNISTDVLIIGGGITGITNAFLLSKSKIKVALIESDSLCSNATGATTAFLTQSIDTEYSKLINMFGNKASSTIADSHQYALDFIEKIIKKEKIECEFRRCSNYSYGITYEDSKRLREETLSEKRLGMNSRYIEGNFLGFINSGAIELKDQAKFHPIKYLSSLVKISSSNNVLFFENTKAIDIKKEDGKFLVKTQKGIINAKKIIMATYAPLNNKLFFKKAFYQSYIYELKIPSNKIKEGIYEDTQDPYHYFRIDKKKGFDRMIIGGEDHRSDIKIHPEKNFKALKDYIEEYFLGLDYTIVRRWRGPIVEPVDGIAFIGKLSSDDDIYYATGFSGNGMTYSTISALIIYEDIMNKKTKKIKEFASVYDANRIPKIKDLAYKGLDYAKEFINGAFKNSIKYKIG